MLKQIILSLFLLTSHLALADDSEIVKAFESHKAAFFVEGSQLEVVQLLPLDNQGLRHQNFVVKLSTGRKVKIVYNLSMCPPVPVKVGDFVSVGGQFIWSKYGGLIHWVHKDPSGRRPDGYVELKGKFYCRD